MYPSASLSQILKISINFFQSSMEIKQCHVQRYTIQFYFTSVKLMNHHTEFIRNKHPHRHLKPSKYSEAQLPRQSKDLTRQKELRKKSIRSRTGSRVGSNCKTQRKSCNKKRLLKVNSAVMKAQVRVDGCQEQTERRKLFDSRAKRLIINALDEDQNSRNFLQKQKILKRCIGEFEKALGRVQSRPKLKSRKLHDRRQNQNIDPFRFQSVNFLAGSQKKDTCDISSSMDLQSNYLKIRTGKGVIRAMNPFKSVQKSTQTRKSILESLPLQLEHTVKQQTQESSVMGLSISEIKQQKDSILTVFNRLEPFQIND